MPLVALPVSARHRRQEIVGILDVAADQHVAAGDLAGELRRRRTAIVDREEIDRQLGEDRAVGPFGQLVIDAAGIGAEGVVARRHRIGEQGRQLRRLAPASCASRCRRGRARCGCWPAAPGPGAPGRGTGAGTAPANIRSAPRCRRCRCSRRRRGRSASSAPSSRRSATDPRAAPGRSGYRCRSPWGASRRACAARWRASCGRAASACRASRSVWSL